jgi:O-antigen/teichoic acid export membrane protein
MIKVFISLNALRVIGLGLNYITIAILARTHGIEEMGYYFFLLNTIITVGALASADIPTIVQRLGARLDETKIGAATWLVIRSRLLIVISTATVASSTVLWLDADQSLSLVSTAKLALSGLGFALTLGLTETLRISKGPLQYEIQRSIVRPALTLIMIISGVDLGASIFISVLASLLIVTVATLRTFRNRGKLDRTEISELKIYTASRSGDSSQIFILNVLGVLFANIDILIFGLLYDNLQTGVYGAASRFAMLINVAILAGNAQMVQTVARVAANGSDDRHNVALLKNQVRLVRVSVTGLLIVISLLLPAYAKITYIPIAELLPFFITIAFSCWLQGMLGPSNMMLLHSHQITRLIAYNVVGILIYASIAIGLHSHGFAWAVPMGAAVGLNTVKLLSWIRVRQFNGIEI